VIGIRVTAENVTTGEVKHTNTSYFTMVAKHDDGSLAEVPYLLLETREDIRRFLESIKRKELKNTYKQELNNAKTRMQVDEELYRLEGERCEIKK
jgi:acyl-CoA hydrolase